jgi:two-component system, NtrC family, sensor kinase
VDMDLIAARQPADISSPAAAAGVPHPPGRRRARGGLFRKYLILFIGLVSAALLINAGIEVAFAYRENRNMLARLQAEKADAVALRISQFIGEIERQVGWTTQGQWAAGSVDQRRFDYVRLLRQVPAITELRQLDAAGKEQLKVSRLAMDVVASGTDFSHDALFTDALAHKASFSQVYFRNESEPYLTIAIAGSGRNPGVTIAEVNLKLIWDVIRGLQIGRNGYAYVVDRQGRLIAHPDISLVLRNTKFTMLPQVAAGMREMGGAASVSAPEGTGMNNTGERMLSAHAALPALGWLVFVELPRAEALEPLIESAMRTAAVLLAGLVLAALVAWFMVRRMVGPIRLLQAGAARIGAGDLDSRIDVQTGDELESLADQFNTMAGQLRQSYSGLEHKVAERTRELHESLEELKAAQANLIQAEKMASLGQLTAGIAHEIKNPLNFVNNFAILSVELLNELKETTAPALPLLQDRQRADAAEVIGMLTSNLEKITEHGRRADGIVKSMLEHSRGSSGERRTVDLNTLIEEALNLAYHGARAQDQSFSITLERDFGSGIAPIELSPQDIMRAFLNVFSNGFYAAAKRARSGALPEFEPTLKVTTRSLGDAVEVRVRDNGAGIPADIRDKLFQPFFTTKPTGEGTGLGLSIAYDVVTQQHGGTITVDSEVDTFTEFVITLPRRGFASDNGRRT